MPGMVEDGALDHGICSATCFWRVNVPRSEISLPTALRGEYNPFLEEGWSVWQHRAGDNSMTFSLVGMCRHVPSLWIAR